MKTQKPDRLIEDHPRKMIEDHPQHLIEDHPRKMIEDHPRPLIEDRYPIEDAIPPAVPMKGSAFGWLGWVACAILVVAVGFCGIYFNSSHNRRSAGESQTAALNVSAAANRQTDVRSRASSSRQDGEVVGNYVYYFGNDQADVSDNSILDRLAEEARTHDAEIDITGYASSTGDLVYNEGLSERRAESVADYLVAHGVDRSHIHIEGDGATSQFGPDSRCRRVEIHMEYKV